MIDDMSHELARSRTRGIQPAGTLSLSFSLRGLHSLGATSLVSTALKNRGISLGAEAGAIYVLSAIRGTNCSVHSLFLIDRALEKRIPATGGDTCSRARSFVSVSLLENFGEFHGL